MEKFTYESQDFQEINLLHYGHDFYDFFTYLHHTESKNAKYNSVMSPLNKISP